MAAFPDWITKKFLDWQSQQGKRKTIDDFAAYIGVSRPLLNQWMNGNIPRPGRENISRLSEIFGVEIYDALELPRPNPLLQRLSIIWENIPPEKQQQFLNEAEAYEVKHERSKKAPAKRKTAKG
jgi:transcriptional regulator with XRE-family HTH domain